MTMTLEKAIELTQQDLDDPGSVDIMDLREAHLLCIEAMKRLQDMRISPCTTADETLPGEAIERLETFVERHTSAGYSDLIPSINLGIEALKQCQRLRELRSEKYLLPGETKE